jgi:uncharacterized damage-inducible protein DinB
MPQKTKAKASRNSAAKKPKKAANGKSTVSTSSAKQQLIDSLTREHAKTLKVLRALPPGQAEFRPHPRSQSARELAWTFVMEQLLIVKALNDQLSLGGGYPAVPSDFQAIVGQFERDFQGLVEQIKKTPEAKLVSTVQFPVGPGQMGDWSKTAFAWFMLSDQIHHRGQLSVYVRMAGGKVPAIYGPSADEPWR